MTFPKRVSKSSLTISPRLETPTCQDISNYSKKLHSNCYFIQMQQWQWTRSYFETMYDRMSWMHSRWGIEHHGAMDNGQVQCVIRGTHTPTWISVYIVFAKPLRAGELESRNWGSIWACSRAIEFLFQKQSSEKFAHKAQPASETGNRVGIVSSSLQSVVSSL